MNKQKTKINQTINLRETKMEEETERVVGREREPGDEERMPKEEMK